MFKYIVMFFVSLSFNFLACKGNVVLLYKDYAGKDRNRFIYSLIFLCFSLFAIFFVQNSINI